MLNKKPYIFCKMKNQKLDIFLKKSKAALAVFLIIVLLGTGVYLCFQYSYKQDRDKALQKINSTILTMDDVMGRNLPLWPDGALNNSTIEGIDANSNTIRDDVELAIFEKYPNSARMRAALLQYSQAIQLELTQVNSEEAMRVSLAKHSEAFACLFSITSELSYQDRTNIEQEIETLILNTEIRKNQYEVVYKNYMNSFTSSNQGCNIDLSILPN